MATSVLPLTDLADTTAQTLRTQVMIPSPAQVMLIMFTVLQLMALPTMVQDRTILTDQLVARTHQAKFLAMVAKMYTAPLHQME